MVMSFWGPNQQLLTCRFQYHLCCRRHKTRWLIKGGEGLTPRVYFSIIASYRYSCLLLHRFSTLSARFGDGIIVCRDYWRCIAFHVSSLGLIRKPTSFVSETSRTAVMCGK